MQHLLLQSRREARPQLVDEGALLADVGDHALGGIGRRRGPHIGDVVEQRTVVLMADGADDRRRGGRDCAHEPLVAEAEQRLRVAAAAGDDDHIDGGVGIELLEGGHHLGDAALALDGRMDRAELHLRPAQLRIAQHVFLGVGVRARDETDAGREERERLLAGVLEQALLLELPTQALELSRAGRRARRGASTTPGTRTSRAS